MVIILRCCNGTAERRLSFIRPDCLRCYCP